MPVFIDPVSLDRTHFSGIAAGYAEHGLYRRDGSPVVSATLVQGKRIVQGSAHPEFVQKISEIVEGEWVYGVRAHGQFAHFLLETCARLSVFSDVELLVIFSTLKRA